jgi:uncharacterized membrane protein HdeD (DUF308 family)
VEGNHLLIMISRVGSALILVGLIALMVFLVMLTTGQADWRLLLAGAALAALGLLLRRRAARTEPSARFRTLRRMLGHRPEDE